MRGYAAIGLYHPKTPENVGSVLRALHCYDAALVAIEGKRFKKSRIDTYRTWRHKPLIETEDLRLIIPYDCVPVAVDLIPGAQSLVNYRHPERAFYIFGPEDGTLGQKVLSWCHDVVYIPTIQCMNLAATVNVVLYDRLAKHPKGHTYNQSTSKVTQDVLSKET
jgi:tRNA(Leu) C34 or U34 (ribose-2'-O)-methylase TrmL